MAKIKPRFDIGNNRMKIAVSRMGEESIKLIPANRV